MPPVILWFRRNLRLRDNRALMAAVDSGQPVIPVYVSNPADSGGASRWWLHHSLTSLQRSLEKRDSRLVIRSGDPAKCLGDIVTATGADTIFYSRRYEPGALADELNLEKALSDTVTLAGVDDSLLNHPDTVMTQGDSPYRVFTPFWRSASKRGEPPAPERGIPDLRPPEPEPDSIALAELKLLPTKPDWAGGLRETWQPGEDGAHERLDDLADSVARYAELRDRPDFDGTSRLSPHLHFGEVSVRQVWDAVRSAEQQGLTSDSAEALLRQLYWRDFSYYLLYHFPKLPDTPLRDEFEHFPWIEDETLLNAWQQGKTGYPIVDAGMRQLWHTGWMHNRVRMIVASFLIKDLMIPWQRGADWFLDTLVDADLANNSASWQWVAGCGTDAAPYFRIFNPTRQGEKFDPKGDYVSRWVPEALTGKDYPRPVVDHGEARKRALEAYSIMRSAR